MRLSRLVAVLLLIVAQTGCEGGHEGVTHDRLERYFQELARNEEFNGSVLVAESGTVVFQMPVGYADFASRRLNTPDIAFPIASLSKLLTTTAILQLVQAGTLSVGDPVVKYLPGFPYPSVTVRHLLSHTSGLPPYNVYFDSLRTAQPERVFSNADFLPQVRAHPVPLLYPPGQTGNYDNINFIVLAEILEKVSGTSYRDYVERHVLRPAGMRHTSLHLSPLFSDSTEALALPHIYPHRYSSRPIAARTIPYAVGYWLAYQFAGFSGYVSTQPDLLRFDRALRSESLLDQRTLREAYEPVRLNDGRVNPNRFGLGWDVEADSSMGTIVYHSGAATGLSCVLLRNVTTDQTVIVFDNAHYDAHRHALNALRILNGREVARPHRSLARVFGMVLASRGAEAARDTLERLQGDTSMYALSEDEFNRLGYDFMGQNDARIYHLPEDRNLTNALAVFKLNTELFPHGWNAWDSYGEALLASSRRAEAITMYQRSLAINPRNENGRRVLDSLQHPIRR